MNSKNKKMLITFAFIVFLICMLIGAYIARNGTL